MKKQIETTQDISRKEALKKIGTYGKYAALTALGTYLILNPQKAQAASNPGDPGGGFNSRGSRRLNRRSNRRFNRRNRRNRR